MTGKFFQRRRAAVLTAAAAAVLLGAGLLAATLGSGAASAGTAGTATRSESTAPGVAVPWGSVGTNWVLAEYSTGTSSKPAPETLYLVSPSGTKYPVYKWKSSASVPLLVAWAANKTEALIGGPTAKGYTYDELNLRTGKLTALTLAGKAEALGYTQPTGQQILGETETRTGITVVSITLSRYTQAGKLVKKLVTENSYGNSALYSPNGAELAVYWSGGLLLVSNNGGVLRKLPVPGISPDPGCVPQRWWNATTILASCSPRTSVAQQLWLVPVSGAKPSALTPVRPSGEDPGDVDAWRLSSGLYLQSGGFCDSEVNKQAKNGSVIKVTVPGPVGNPVILTATSSRLLVESVGCGGGGQLAWFNPATRAEQWLFKTGTVTAMAYGSDVRLQLEVAGVMPLRPGHPDRVGNGD